MKELLKNIVSEQAAEFIIKNYPTPKMLINATERELMAIPNLSSKKAKDIKTIVAICQEILKPSRDICAIKSPQDVYELLHGMEFNEVEVFNVILLTTKNTIIDTVLISKGSLNATIVHPREVFTSAVRMKANAIICVHSHPSGDPEPSKEDCETTKRLRSAGDILGIKLVDHIIIGSGKYLSMKERGLIIDC